LREEINMRKKIFGILVCMLLSFTTLSTIGIAGIDNSQTSYDKSGQPFHGIYLEKNNNPPIRPLQYGDALDQYMIEPTNFGWMVCLFQWVAQGFTPNMSILTRIEIELFKLGNPPPETQIYIGLFDDLDGEELAYTIFTGEQFNETRKWFTLDMEDMIVEPGHTYYIICFTDYFSYYDGYYWFAATNNPYNRGDAWYSMFGYYEWLPLDNPPDYPLTDCTFKTYGIDKDKMKWTFIRGSISNQSSIQNYTVLKSENLICLQMFPFNRVQYTDDEKVTIYNKGLGFVKNGRVFGLFKAHI
jgi:hypothetical protein